MNREWQFENSSSSISENIFLTLRVKLRTEWFQWLCTLFSRAGNMSGRITCLLCAIRSTIWSLFQRNSARSATLNGKFWANKKVFLNMIRKWNYRSIQDHVTKVKQNLSLPLWRIFLHWSGWHSTCNFYILLYVDTLIVVSHITNFFPRQSYRQSDQRYHFVFCKSTTRSKVNKYRHIPYMCVGP